MKRAELTKLTIQKLAEKPEAKAEGEWIVSLCLNVKRSNVYSQDSVMQEEIDAVNNAVEQRLKNVPLDYIFGKSNFYGFDLVVNPNVLIPRPETEELVEKVSKEITYKDKVLDIGTGSGAIAIAIQKLTNAKVFAVDISQGALEVAKQNAKNNNADIEFVLSDLFENIKEEKFNYIISNPPYISNEEYELLQNEVKDYEPITALVAEENGLAIYKRIIKDAPNFLEENGRIVFEIGCTQAQAITKMLEKDFVNIEVYKDFAGLDRVVCATLNTRRK